MTFVKNLLLFLLLLGVTNKVFSAPLNEQSENLRNEDQLNIAEDKEDSTEEDSAEESGDVDTEGSGVVAELSKEKGMKNDADEGSAIEKKFKPISDKVDKQVIKPATSIAIEAVAKPAIKPKTKLARESRERKFKKRIEGIDILENTDAALNSKIKTERPVCRSCKKKKRCDDDDDDEGCKEEHEHHDCHDEKCCHCERNHDLDEDEHHHHGHHHGFIHEWGDEEDGEHHGEEGRGDDCCDHLHCHKDCDDDCDGHCREGENHHEECGGHCHEGDGGNGYGWCRDVIQTSKSGKFEKVVQRFCVPLGYQGGYGGYPYFYGYPGVGLGLYGWGWPWIKNKVPGSVGVKAPVKKPAKKEVNKEVNKTIKKVNKDTAATKRQTVHVGYGYASGDNYRLGYQEGGMGGLSSNTFDDDQHNNDFNHKKSTVQKRRGFGMGMGMGSFDSRMEPQQHTPYGHPVTHPGFTTMGFPGHALASVDVRNKIRRSKRQVYEKPVFYTQDYLMPNIFHPTFEY
ncbi:uncharacterized protein LOC101239391 isoform X3 [Hydra vulgaris]|uniref:Uncharacterized protein LOC101239391 isoform X3 n=1 Tax=Hydra vulgaris TaxID=6087 RepID=A0ABM4D835_HYDVU